GAALELRVAASRDALTAAFKSFADALGTFDPNDLAAYTALESRLQTLGDTLDAAFTVLETLYAALTAAVAAPAWDSLFGAYADVLGAIHLDDVPTVDDAVDAMAGMVESLLSQLSMSLSPRSEERRVGKEWRSWWQPHR